MAHEINSRVLCSPLPLKHIFVKSYLNAIRNLNSVLMPVSSKTSLMAASDRFSPGSTYPEILV
jgi:hypothetical protein